MITTCATDLKELRIEHSKEVIPKMSKYQYTKILKEEIMKNASYYLIRKCGKKGTEIEYSCLQMADYLQPFCADLTIEQKSEMFAVRNWIIQIDYNFSKNNLQTKCWCNDNEDMRHIIYQCELLSDTNNERKISTLRKNPRPYSKCLFGVCLMGVSLRKPIPAHHPKIK